MGPFTVKRGQSGQLIAEPRATSLLKFYFILPHHGTVCNWNQLSKGEKGTYIYIYISPLKFQLGNLTSQEIEPEILHQRTFAFENVGLSFIAI